MLNFEPQKLKKFELVLAVALTAIILCFHIARVAKAGGLWRDEAAAVQLATMPSVMDVIHYFPHEAFPLLFPAVVRTYSLLAGNSDLAWRVFGLLVGMGIIGALWWNMRVLRHGVPLLSLALIGFNGAFIEWGDSMRGYGLGIVFILLTVGLLWRVANRDPAPRPRPAPEAVWRGKPSVGVSAGLDLPGLPSREQGGSPSPSNGEKAGVRGSAFRSRFPVLIAFACTIASVQCLLHNAILVLAICVGAMTVAIARKRARRAAARPQPVENGANKPPPKRVRRLDFRYLAIYTVENRAFMLILFAGLAAAVSLLPYWGPLSRAREWDIVIRMTVGLDDLCHKLNLALSSSGVWNTWVWALLLLGGLTACLVGQFRPNTPGFGREQRSVLFFAGAGIVIAVVGYFSFLLLLSYPSEPWYYLALMAVVALFLDLAFDVLCGERRSWAGIGRLALTVAIAAAALVPTWRQANVRLTNIDLLAATLNQRVEQQDLVVVAPWYVGISFSRYYRGPAAWTTVPPLDFYKFHRYDLIKAKMVLPDQNEPLRPVQDQIRETLKNGHRVWLVSLPGWLKPGESIPELAPAPDPKWGWLNDPYSTVWTVKAAAYLQVCARRFEVVPVSSPGPVNPFEDETLRVFEGL